jgi:16S rRNA processing protein RimM
MRPEASLLTVGTRVTVAGVARRIERRAGTAERPIVRVEGAADRDAALALRGEPLWVERADAPPLDEDEFWADDLVGADAVDGDRAVGTVSRVLALPSCEVLVVERAGEAELLVPLVGDAVRAVDLQARRIDVDLAFLGEE